MSESKKHHYIPQWLMKYWADEKSRVICVDRRKAPTIRNFVTNVSKVNYENRLYTFTTGDGNTHDKLETEIYAPLDYAAANLTKKLCQILDRGQVPDMNFESRKLLWQFFYYNAFKRLPGSLEGYLKEINYEELRENTIQKVIADGVDEERVRRITQSLDVRTLVEQQGIQFARAEQNDETLDIFANFGIIFAVAIEGTSFILPHRSTIIQDAASGSSSQEHWIPFHPKYAFRGVTPDRTIRLVSMDKSEVRRLNENWYANANTVILTSKKQAVSLVKRHDRQKISF